VFFVATVTRRLAEPEVHHAAGVVVERAGGGAVLGEAGELPLERGEHTRGLFRVEARQQTHVALGHKNVQSRRIVLVAGVVLHEHDLGADEGFGAAALAAQLVCGGVQGDGVACGAHAQVAGDQKKRANDGEDLRLLVAALPEQTENGEHDGEGAALLPDAVFAHGLDGEFGAVVGDGQLERSVGRHGLIVTRDEGRGTRD